MAAKKSLASGKYEKALKEADAAVKAAPTSAAAHMVRSKALARTGDRDTAIKAAEKAVRLDSTSGVYLSQLAQLYYDAGRLDDAISTAKRAVDLRGGYEGYKVLGRVWKRKGNTSAAIDAFKKWLNVSPSRDKAGIREIVEVLIRKSPPPKKTSGMKCSYVEDCPGLELCDDGTCG